MPILKDLITALPVSRNDYINGVVAHAFHITSHLVEAVEFREGKHNTKGWLAQTENALRAGFNTPTDKRLKALDFDTIYKKLAINDDNARFLLKGEVSKWFKKNKTLSLSKTTTADIAKAVSNIIYEQCKLAYRFRVELHTQVPDGVLVDSLYAWELIGSFEKLDTRLLLKKNPTEIERLLYQIETSGVID